MSKTYLDYSGLSHFLEKLDNRFAPKSHTHGNITNDGKLGTASRVVITDGSKNITTSSTTSTEVGYLSGVTSNVQTQINAKADASALPTIVRYI